MRDDPNVGLKRFLRLVAARGVVLAVHIPAIHELAIELGLELAPAARRLDGLAETLGDLHGLNVIAHLVVGPIRIRGRAPPEDAGCDP